LQIVISKLFLKIKLTAKKFKVLTIKLDKKMIRFERLFDERLFKYYLKIYYGDGIVIDKYRTIYGSTEPGLYQYAVSPIHL